jgi:hypothetical protein
VVITLTFKITKSYRHAIGRLIFQGQADSKELLDALLRLAEAFLQNKQISRSDSLSIKNGRLLTRNSFFYLDFDK